MSNSIVVGDADALIGLVLENDPHHIRTKQISEYLQKKRITIIFPVTAFPEAITSLKRASNQPEKAHLINEQYLAGEFNVEFIDEAVMRRAAEIFDKAVSKQNTLFDAIVAATAEKLEADAIFSFDDWYPKLGFKLAGDLVITSTQSAQVNLR